MFGDDGDRIESWSKEKFKDRIFYVGQGLPDRCFMHFQPSGMKTENLACPLGIKKAFSNNMAIKLIKFIVTNNKIVSDLIEGGLLFSLYKFPNLGNKDFF